MSAFVHFIRWSMLMLIIGLLTCCQTSSVQPRQISYLDGSKITVIPETPSYYQYEGKLTVKNMKGQPGAKVTSYEYCRVLEQTRKIPARLHRGFGLNMVIKGLPDGRHLLDVQIDSPPVIDPRTGRPEVLGRTSHVVSKNGEAHWNCAYSFDRPVDLNPGKWRFSVRYRGQEIYADQVEVVLE
jgi:hypothetical protein